MPASLLNALTRRPRAMPLLVFAALLLAVAHPVQAATTTTTFNVTATVLNSCSVTATDLAFGTYDPASVTDKQGASTITVTCTLGTAYYRQGDYGAAQRALQQALSLV